MPNVLKQMAECSLTTPYTAAMHPAGYSSRCEINPHSFAQAAETKHCHDFKCKKMSSCWHCCDSAGTTACNTCRGAVSQETAAGETHTLSIETACPSWTHICLHMTGFQWLVCKVSLVTVEAHQDRLRRRQMHQVFPLHHHESDSLVDDHHSLMHCYGCCCCPAHAH